MFRILINSDTLFVSVFTICSIRISFVDLDYIKNYMNKAIKNIEKLLKELFSKLDFSDYILKIGVRYEPKDEMLYVNISTKEPQFLIGFRGKTLYALEHLFKTLYFSKHKELPKIAFDISDYKAKNVLRLESIAKKTIDKVIRSRRPEVLLPLNAYERRVIHSYITANSNLATESIGEEPNRRIVVKIKKS